MFTVNDVYRLCWFHLGFDQRHKGWIDRSVQSKRWMVGMMTLVSWGTAFPLIDLQKPWGETSKPNIHAVRGNCCMVTGAAI